MKHIWTIATKELRSFFNSAVALIFLASFLGAVLFFLFWKEKFFARGIADVRPMFEWFPLLLIFLVAALTMRLWSEEQKLGTLEILLTLPVSPQKLVLGKFLAGLLLVCLALLLTLGVPITVSMMGNLDWGPVFGAYAGAILLAGSYLAIGLCISSLTDNQVLALIFTVLACFLLYVPGMDAIAGLFDYEGAETMRKIGTGSRFESIARGVIDLRDIVYYGGMIALFLVVNTAILHAKRWSSGTRTWMQRFNVKLVVGLCLVNVLLANLWLAPVNAARIDITSDGEYSLSPVTHKLLGSLDEPLLIRAYISKKTHPLVSPLVPQVRDLLREYGVAGGSKVRVEFTDPLGNDTQEKEAKKAYNIDAMTFRFAERNQRAMINAYFSVLIKYGDQFEVLNIMDMLEVEERGDAIDVRVGNLEYDMTRSIKRVIEGFQNKDRLFDTIAGKITLTAYLTPKTLPENLKDVPKRIEAVASELAKKSGGKFKLVVEEPTTEAQIRTLFEKYQLRPFRVSLLSRDVFYMHLVLDVGGTLSRVVPGEAMTEAEIRDSLEEAIRRSAPGYLKKVAIWAPKGFQMPGNPQFGQRPQKVPPAQGFKMLRQKLEDNYELVDANLSTGHLGDDIDMLILAGPENITGASLYAVDQFLMRGGTVVVFTGTRLERARGIKVGKVTSGLAPALKTWGLEIDDKLVLDKEAEELGLPMPTDDGRMRLTQIQYPFFARIGRSGMNKKSLITHGIPAMTMQFSSPIKSVKAADVTFTPLVQTSKESWTQADLNVMLDAAGGGFEQPKDLKKDSKGPYDIGVVLTGTFTSHFAETGRPAAGAGPGGAPPAQDKTKADRTIKRSPAKTRLVVIASSVSFSDEGQQFAAQLSGSRNAQNNLMMAENIVSWAIADEDMLKIRARGSHNRALDLKKDEHSKWEWINYSIALIGLFLVAGISFARRRMLSPVPLMSREKLGMDKEPEPEPEPGPHRGTRRGEPEPEPEPDPDPEPEPGPHRGTRRGEPDDAAEEADDDKAEDDR